MQNKEFLLYSTVQIKTLFTIHRFKGFKGFDDLRRSIMSDSGATLHVIVTCSNP